MMFRGREIVHKELGNVVMEKFFDKVKDQGDKEGPISSAGREMNLILTPKK
ncbi:MAG: Translation initiation factor IF-3 [candidate division CPR2 bacterium GW2011_GWC1_39_9]|uniref:Translation initiation factor IF-3 n=1 Tax=candidate division CPR2 bacterium GW2011_GWC2_39_10 TaxID=1618345 RepID=A0A0G0LQK7_UNCC2|nr:MAG: Translation initiation factor IF-3 [candidate division CPR2 bacterium GW2011_GWC2_39_10]KKR34548.1 MAG: Translation initiation factor IF-3 [candidate division CPR2 bacterium GW2011_GWC1_39_9]